MTCRSESQLPSIVNRKSSIEMVEHKVNNDAGDRDVEPEGERPMSDAPMPVESLFKRPAQSDEHQGNHGNCQKRVRSQNRKINRTQPSLSLKPYRPNSRVIDQVRNEKET